MMMIVLIFTRMMVLWVHWVSGRLNRDQSIPITWESDGPIRWPVCMVVAVALAAGFRHSASISDIFDKDREIMATLRATLIFSELVHPRVKCPLLVLFKNIGKKLKFKPLLYSWRHLGDHITLHVCLFCKWTEMWDKTQEPEWWGNKLRTWLDVNILISLIK